MENKNKERWPVADNEGYYQPYKERGRWMNWWTRDKPANFRDVTKLMVCSPDRSNIPSKQADVDRDLPTKKPYWLEPNFDTKEKMGDGIKATWIGHATVLAEVDSVVIITDPMFSQRASPSQLFGPKRFTQPACKIEELPYNLRAVVISHNHFDHLDHHSVSLLHKKYKDSLHWFIPQDMGSWFTSNFSIKKDNLHELTWWQETTLPGTEVKFILTPANHGCRRGLCDEDEVLWGSWAVIGPRNRFWFGGDTAYADVFKQIGQRYGPFNLSAIPVGAYDPKWFMSHYHVDPKEAVMIHKDIKSFQSLAIHWGTFKLTYEPYMEPRSETRKEAELAGLGTEEIMVVNLGETVEGKHK